MKQVISSYVYDHIPLSVFNARITPYIWEASDPKSDDVLLILADYDNNVIDEAELRRRLAMLFGMPSFTTNHNKTSWTLAG